MWRWEERECVGVGRVRLEHKTPEIKWGTIRNKYSEEATCSTFLTSEGSPLCKDGGWYQVSEVGWRPLLKTLGKPQHCHTH